MKIFHILNDIQKLGNGIINVAIDLACLQAKAGHGVYVVSAGGDYECLLAKHGVNHVLLDQKRSLGNLVKATSRYFKLIQEIQPDIIHAHMMTGLGLSWALNKFGNYKLVATVHNEFQKTSIFMGLADQVIAVSDAVAESMIAKGISPKKICIVKNGTIGSPRSLPINSYNPHKLCRPAIVTVCGMYKRKGVQDLIAAFDKIASNHPTANLYLVGDGPDREKFEVQAQVSLASDRIHFEGFQAEPQRYLLSADIFVLASHRDPCPLVISEAREAGCAIIASNVDGIPELLVNGEAGLLVSPDSHEALVQALITLLKSAEAVDKLKKNSTKTLACLTADRVCEETIAVYRELL